MKLSVPQSRANHWSHFAKAALQLGISNPSFRAKDHVFSSTTHTHRIWAQRSGQAQRAEKEMLKPH